MMTLQPAQPLSPAVSPDGHEAFFALLRLIADPGGASKRLQELTDATVKANQAIVNANEELKKLEAARKEHDATLQRERQDHQRKIAQGNAELTSSAQQARSELAARERALKELEAKAALDAKVASHLRADLARRVDLVRTASADLKVGAA